MTNSWNLDKLSYDARLVIAFAFERMTVGWTLCYMVEVRLDDPIRNLLAGGLGLETHGGNGSRCYARHYNDPGWAVVHCDDEDFRALAIDIESDESKQVLERLLKAKQETETATER